MSGLSRPRHMGGPAHCLQDQLDECAIDFMSERRMTWCLQRVQTALNTLGDEWVAFVFGSVPSGFGSRTSDLDVTCLRPRASPELSQSHYDMEMQIAPLFRQSQEFEVIAEVFAAKVPVIKLLFDGCLEVDLSCNNFFALANTRLLRAYAQMHPVISSLVRAVKIWATSVGICGAVQGHLSSYSFALMTIYFLQVGTRNDRLPCFPTAPFEHEGAGLGHPSVLRLVHRWLRKGHRLELVAALQQFFAFYSQDFRWGTEVVSIRRGQRLSIQSSCYTSLAGSPVDRLHIEDPYDIGRNLNCVLDLANEKQLRSRLAEASEAIRSGHAPSGVAALRPPVPNHWFGSAAPTPASTASHRPKPSSRRLAPAGAVAAPAAAMPPGLGFSGGAEDILLPAALLWARSWRDLPPILDEVSVPVPVRAPRSAPRLASKELPVSEEEEDLRPLVMRTGGPTAWDLPGRVAQPSNREAWAAAVAYVDVEIDGMVAEAGWQEASRDFEEPLRVTIDTPNAPYREAYGEVIY